MKVDTKEIVTKLREAGVDDETNTCTSYDSIL